MKRIYDSYSNLVKLLRKVVDEGEETTLPTDDDEVDVNVDGRMNSKSLSRSPSHRLSVTSNINPSSKSLYWRCLLLIVCAILSTNFPVLKIIQNQHVDILTPSLYASIRFSLASIVLLPNTVGRWNDIKVIRESVVIGVFKALGYFGQAIGMLTSTANKGAFIYSMNVVWVAFLSSMIVSSCRLQVWCSIAVALFGISCLEFDGNEPPKVEDLWLLLQPIGFGTAAILLERLLYKDSILRTRIKSVKESPDAAAVTAFSIGTTAFISFIWAYVDGHQFSDIQSIFSSQLAISGLLYEACVCTACAMILKNEACKHVSATDIALIMALEPLFAAVLDAGWDLRKVLS
jgi:drug/metabolite transporter (DMT)-like permease